MIVFLSNIATAAPIDKGYYEMTNVARVDFYTLGVFNTVYSNQVVDQVEANLGVHLVIDGTGTTKTPELYVGGVIDYKLVVKVEGEGEIKDVVITDNIPAGTTYENNTLKVNGVLSEALYAPGIITVPLGNMTSKDVHFIEFSVKVNQIN